VIHGEFARGSTATSHLLPGFAVAVTDALAAASRSRTAPRPASARRSRGREAERRG
jgi:hypothetical protein